MYLNCFPCFPCCVCHQCNSRHGKFCPVEPCRFVTWKVFLLDGKVCSCIMSYLVANDGKPKMPSDHHFPSSGWKTVTAIMGDPHIKRENKIVVQYRKSIRITIILNCNRMYCLWLKRHKWLTSIRYYLFYFNTNGVFSFVSSEQYKRYSANSILFYFKLSVNKNIAPFIAMYIYAAPVCCLILS